MSFNFERHYKFLKHFVFLIVLFISADLLAQYDVNSTEFDNKYTPNQHSIFNAFNSDNRNFMKKPGTAFTVWATPTMLFRKKLFASLEWAVNDKVNLCAGLGKAFDTDPFLSTSLALMSFGSVTQNEDLSARNIVKNSSYTGSSPLVRLGLKFNYKDEFNTENRIECFYQYEKLQFELDSVISTSSFSSSKSYIRNSALDATFSTHSFAVGYGFQFTTHDKRFTHYLFSNGGIRFINYTQFVFSKNNTTSPFKTYNECERTESTNIRTTLWINIGYSFGFKL